MKGKEGFMAYYQDQLPWLDFDPAPILLLHPAYQANLPFSSQPLDWYPGAWLWPNGFARGTELPGWQEGYFYVMNAASLKPILALDPLPGEHILDACAAPGGKTVAIAHRLQDQGQLDCTDSSPARLHRLRETVGQLGYTNITTHNRKAEILFKRFPNVYDGILLDAPCSSEKHVWHSPKYLAEWSLSRIKRLKQQQIALLNGLWLALKPGGRIVYVTCALNTEENEGVIADFQNRHPEATITQQERIVPTPDLFDPLFYSRIEKPV